MSRLIVKNLPKTITEDKIRKLFSERGQVTDVQLKYTKDGRFRQFCFVGFQSDEQADDAQGYFNNSCINTTKITVQKCTSLGDETKPKSWSKYAPDSSAYKKLHPEEKKPDESKPDGNEPEKKSKIQELLEKYKDDPMFEEYMQLHGIKDMNALLRKLTVTSDKILGETEKVQPEADSDSGHESTEGSAEKAADQQISDLEYMKFLMKKSETNEERRKRMEKQPREKIKLYMVKMRGLAYGTKKRDVKHFLSPLVPYTIRIPPKIKGIAYVGFRLEKQMRQALAKHKSFLGGRQVSVYKYADSKDSVEAAENAVGGGETARATWADQAEALRHEEDISESGRVFLRNLSYSTTEEDVRQLFSPFGPLTEVNLPLDKHTRRLKGFGVVTFLMPEHAVRAYAQLDGSVLHGRMLHLLPGRARDAEDPPGEQGKDGGYKRVKAQRDRAQAGSAHNWNTLFVGADAVADVIADTYGASKQDVLDWRGSGSAAVRLALGETQLVAATRAFLEGHGVQLDAFNRPAAARSRTVLLAKNLPAHTRPADLQALFGRHGLLGRVLLPPSGVTALIEFLEPSEARAAFTKLAYTKFKDAPLYLEWAPDDALQAVPAGGEASSTEQPRQQEQPKQQEQQEQPEQPEPEEPDEPPEPDTTLFVKNLNFTTTEDALRQHFEPAGKINYVMVATKKDPKEPRNRLSMGYGFVRFQSKSSVDRALKDLQQSLLDGKPIELRRSERTLQDDVRNTRKTVKGTKQTGSKILVRNIPFEANRNELMELFQAFGEIKALRLPKKLTLSAEAHRGFAFVDYVSKSDAKKAFQSLSQSTHLYGRRLVLEWASTEEGIDEIRKRTAKHYHPSEELKSKKSVFSIDD